MSLRRLAQTNAASIAPSDSTPSKSYGNTWSGGSASNPSSPTPSLIPVTPRRGPRVTFVPSPASTPSISASTPFDWDAARGLKTPPYGGAANASKRSRLSEAGTGSKSTPGKKFVRKKGLIQKIAGIPSWIAFEWSIFPQNVPLPSPKLSAHLLGGTMHLLHLFVRISQGRKVPDADLGWEDMYREGQNEAWFDWTTPVTILLFAGAALNALYLFTRIKVYYLHLQPDLASSPNVSFVTLSRDRFPYEPPPLTARLRAGSWRAFVAFWRFLLNMSPAKQATAHSEREDQVQQLRMWNPDRLELVLFSIYGPAHPFLWMGTTGANWMLMFFVMILVGVQTHGLILFFETLIKDKALVASEVMNEYNSKFVYPRVNPIRRDVAVMTHQSEMVSP